MENMYNGVTIVGYLNISPNSNITNSVEYGNSNVEITSICPNNVTVFNNGNPQLIK